jgi:hypothetical protein
MDAREIIAEMSRGAAEQVDPPLEAGPLGSARTLPSRPAVLNGVQKRALPRVNGNMRSPV